jgi:Aconitase X
MLDCFRPRDGRILAPRIHARGQLGSSREARRRSKVVGRRANPRFGAFGDRSRRGGLREPTVSLAAGAEGRAAQDADVRAGAGGARGERRGPRERAGLHAALAGRDVLAEARRDGVLSRLEAAGVKVLSDLCWCSISEPVFPSRARTLVTNSGKYAYYGPGLSGRSVRFGLLTVSRRR